MTLLDADRLAQVLECTRRDLFRIETLPSYDTAMTIPDFRRWREGQDGPDWAVRQPWLDTLTQWARQGRPRRRVRVIHDPPTDYERYACEWGYANNVKAGEPTRILDLADGYLPAELADAPGDWWLIDGRTVVKMHYHLDGRFRGAELVAPKLVDRYRRAADVAWRVGQDFDRWWAAHPQYHRSAGRAA